MPIHTTTFERAIHLALFISGGIAFGVVALAGLERIVGSAQRTIKLTYVAVAVAAFAVLAGAEAIFHIVR